MQNVLHGVYNIKMWLNMFLIKGMKSIVMW